MQHPFRILLACFSLFFLRTPAHAQTDVAAFPDLEPITIENASRFVQLPGELTGVNNGFDVSPDGEQIAVARPDGVYLYAIPDFETPIQIFEVLDSQMVYNPQFNPDGNLISVTFFDTDSRGSITRLWEIGTEEVIKEFRTFTWPLNGGADFSPDGNFLAGYDTLYYTCQGSCDPASSLYLWGVKGYSTEPIHSCPLNCYGRYGIGSFTFTPDSKTLLASAYEFSLGDDEGGGYYWWAIDLVPIGETYGVEDGNIPPALLDYFGKGTGPFASEISSIWFSPDGSLLAAYNYKTEIRTFWDVQTGDERLTLPEGIRLSSFLPGNNLLIADTAQETVSVLDMETGEQAIVLENLKDDRVFFSVNTQGILFASYENIETLHFYGVPAD